MENKDIARKYWELVVEEFVDSLNCRDYEEEIELTDDLKNEIVKNLFEDDEMWLKIDETIEWYLFHSINKKI